MKEKKIVICASFGGFGISKEGQMKLYKMGDQHIKEIKLQDYFKADRYNSTKIDIYGQVKWCENEEIKRHADTCEMNILFDKEIIISDDHRDSQNRTCPNLVKIVEKMGQRANGQHAKLKVIKIPTNIKYFIDEYDGNETVHEEHRSWS